ncbi:hypothetical protein [Streptomyces indicus]|uniref:hypothetical protein n=1 Tax=Streptomyces indicus TaxID=417292 RepID=UPI000B870840|nr:hypothetical protein [Streptomyces indicus]
MGRQEEDAALDALLRAHRLITVTGPAGVGKSVLAERVLARQEARITVRVRWPQGGQGSFQGPASAAVAAAISQDRPERAVAALTPLVGDGGGAGEPVLVLLDDIDPLLARCRRTVSVLLRAFPTLKLLVTARRPLGGGDEHALRLRPLSTRSRDGRLPPATRLFVERARAVRPGLVVGPAALREATAVCEMLDGLPLAIEQAAQQLRTLDLGELLPRLRQSQCWLTHPGAALARHRSLRRTIGTVFSLCERRDKAVWARASVLEGTFSESAAAFLCSGGQVPADAVPGCLDRLVAVGVLERLDDHGGRDGARVVRGAAAGGARMVVGGSGIGSAASDSGTGDSTPGDSMPGDSMTVHTLRAGPVPGRERRAGAAVPGTVPGREASSRTGLADTEPEREPRTIVDPPGAVPGGPRHPGTAPRSHPTCTVPGGPRYLMTRAARDFGREMLACAGESEAALERSFIHGRHVATAASQLWDMGSPQEARALVGAELDNIWALLEQAPALPPHADTLAGIVASLWFWWPAQDAPGPGRRHLLLRALCPPYAPDSWRAPWLAGWLTAVHSPKMAGRLLAQAWGRTVLDAHCADAGRIALVQGLIAWREGDLTGADRHLADAARIIPAHATDGPTPALALAFLALAHAPTTPGHARTLARRSLAQPGILCDPTAGFHARLALALADHHAGRTGRAWRRARRLRDALPAHLTGSDAAALLDALLAALGTGAPVPARPGPCLLPAPAAPGQDAPTGPAAA